MRLTEYTDSQGAATATGDIVLDESINGGFNDTVNEE